MAYLKRSRASLRIMGDDLVPEHVTRLLGAQPDLARTKGQRWQTPKGREMVARTGQWHLTAAPQEPADVDAQIAGLLEQCSSDLAVWQALSARFDIDLFCGFFMAEDNEGVSLSPASLQALGERGILLDLDIYAPDDD